jgi:hypothetical protein
MAVKQQSKTQFNKVSSSLDTIGGVPGQRFIIPATTLDVEKIIMCIQYDDGTGSVTCTSHDLLVAYTNSTTGILDPKVYTADKTDLTRGFGQFSVVGLGAFTATNIYGFAVRKGETYVAATVTSIKEGNPLAVTSGGTDKLAEALKSTLSAYNTMTTNDIHQIVGDVWGVALETVAAATSIQRVYVKDC